MSAWMDRAKQWARSIKRDVVVVWLVARDGRTPWPPRVLATCVAAYALSPVDLIPDFIPVLGYLDDLLIVPLGIIAVLRLVPQHLRAEHRAAAATIAARPVSRTGMLVIVAIWILAAIAMLVLLGFW